MKCPVCSGEMKPLFLTSFCPACDERTEKGTGVFAGDRSVIGYVAAWVPKNPGATTCLWQSPDFQHYLNIGTSAPPAVPVRLVDSSISITWEGDQGPGLTYSRQRFTVERAPSDDGYIAYPV
jgi:hypothetical protein